MRKLVFGATFLGTALAVRAAMAGVSTSRQVAGALAILMLLALACFAVVLPALLLSAALRRFFNPDDQLDEPQGWLFVLPGATETRPPAIAAEGSANLRK